jgi:hypothetical protein
MKKIFTTLAMCSFLLITTQGAFAWTYEGMNSLNPFTGFKQCNKCVKVEKCQKQKLTKCEKLRGVKIVKGKNTGCAAPIQTEKKCIQCKRAF